MGHASVLFIILLAPLIQRNLCAEVTCEKLAGSTCSCKFTNGTVIDLTTLAKKDGKTAWFQDVNSTSLNDTYKYSYNPCNAFSEGGCTIDTAVCQISKDGQNYFVIGEQEKVSFSFADQKHVIATYGSSSERQTTVTLVCATKKEERLEVFGETQPESMKYNMTLYSVCACPDGCVSKIPTNEGLSTGSIMVIFFFVILCCYLVGGMLFQKIVKGAEGREIIPHYEFWFDFPLLIRDGVVFVLNGCKTEASYERI